jgi:hypothetical protein
MSKDIIIYTYRIVCNLARYVIVMRKVNIESKDEIVYLGIFEMSEINLIYEL